MAQQYAKLLMTCIKKKLTSASHRTNTEKLKRNGAAKIHLPLYTDIYFHLNLASKVLLTSQHLRRGKYA